MKHIVLSALLAGSSLISGPALGHEGHNKAPGSVAAPHGGAIQGTASLYWELVKEAGGLKLYPLTHDLAPIPPNEVTLTALVTFPKKPKAISIKFTVEGDSFVAKVETKGAHRYTLELSSTYTGKKEKVKFQVEPQS